jgi:hypothetical protein
MSDMYAIKGTTLTALGDAVRSVCNIGPMDSVTAIHMKKGSQQYFYTYPHIAGCYQFRYIFTIYDKVNIAGSSLTISDTLTNTTLFQSGGHLGGADDQTATVLAQTNSIKIGMGIPSNMDGSCKVDIICIPVDENGNEYKYTPLEMVDALGDLNTEAIKKFALAALGSHAATYTLTPKDLEGVTKIGSYAFYQNKLTEVELPNTVIDVEQYAFQYCDKLSKVILPASVTTVRGNAFSHGTVREVRILNDASVINVPITNIEINSPFASTPTDCVFYIPSKLYNAYWDDTYWSKHRHQFVAVGEWAFDPKVNAVLLFNEAKEVSIQLNEFATTPQFTITSSDETVATITNAGINEDNTLLTFTINSLTTEGTSNIEINIVGENTYNFVGTVTVYETIPESTYEIIPQIEGAKYGFALREDGYWESQNFKAGSSAAVCQINISNVAGRPVYIDCINYAESNYDYGILGSVNQELVTANSDDGGVKQNFKGMSKNEVQTITYDDALGNCFIQVKFKKDSSGDQNNDSLRFQVRFGE